MKLQVYSDFKELEPQVEAWRELVLRHCCQPFFMLPEYQISWWQHLGHGSLEILAFYEADALVGLLPLYLDDLMVKGTTKKVYRMVGAVDESDYLDLVIKSEFTDQVYTELITYLAAKDWDAVWLESVPATSKTHTEFAAALTAFGWHSERVEQTVSPVITLPSSYDAYLETLETKQRKHFRHLMSRIGEEDEITYRTVTESAEMPQAIETFIALHKASGTEKKSFWNPAREAFFIDSATQLAKQNVVKLYFLDVNGTPAATMLIFDWQNQFLLYNSGFDAYAYGYLGVSNVLTLHTIEAAIKLGRKRYDFMRGNEPYKFAFQPQPEPVWDLHITRLK